MYNRETFPGLSYATSYRRGKTTNKVAAAVSTTASSSDSDTVTNFFDMAERPETWSRLHNLCMWREESYLQIHHTTAYRNTLLLRISAVVQIHLFHSIAGAPQTSAPQDLLQTLPRAAIASAWQERKHLILARIAATTTKSRCLSRKVCGRSGHLHISRDDRIVSLHPSRLL
jgi:hypothetical protein